MKKNDIKIWLKALRSGVYKQCIKFLHDGEGFCCLDVMIDTLIEGDWIQDEVDPWYFFEGRSNMPNGKILSEIGLDRNVADALASFNDEGKDFNWIADIIEKNADHLLDANSFKE